MTNGIDAVDFSLMTVATVASGELMRMTASVHPVSPMYCEASAWGRYAAIPANRNHDMLLPHGIDGTKCGGDDGARHEVLLGQGEWVVLCVHISVVGAAKDPCRDP